jgi:hypothetical protein
MHPVETQTAHTDTCKTYHNCTYNRLPEDEPTGLKHVEDIKINIYIIYIIYKFIKSAFRWFGFYNCIIMHGA